MKLKTVLLLSFCLTLNSCTLFNGDDLPNNIYEGFYAWGFETNSFTPCHNLDTRWWVRAGNRSAADSLVSKFRSITEQDHNKVFVRLTGDPSKKGEYGHMGGYEREFTIQEVVEVREGEPSDCE